MRSLFWRIFLWFWLAMLLLAVAVAATVYITDPDHNFFRTGVTCLCSASISLPTGASRCSRPAARVRFTIT